MVGGKSTAYLPQGSVQIVRDYVNFLTTDRSLPLSIFLRLEDLLHSSSGHFPFGYQFFCPPNIPSRPDAVRSPWGESQCVALVVQRFEDAIDPAKTEGLLHCSSETQPLISKLHFVNNQPRFSFQAVILFQPASPLVSSPKCKIIWFLFSQWVSLSLSTADAWNRKHSVCS